ncbi:speriolin [Patella vulgata]|uniref:speriolin n=1 Tax=Patella vulgata TaxID=6465 RepID=UPI00217FD62E|nr:speriolin [Patella vulgata]
MSQDDQPSYLPIYDFAGSSTTNSHQQRNEATIMGENHRLKKENVELWKCLRLMRDNSELETANLISSVIAWCDEKFKHKFWELNSALQHHNLQSPPSPFRPISPVGPNHNDDFYNASVSPLSTSSRKSAHRSRQRSRSVSPTQETIYNRYAPSSMLQSTHLAANPKGLYQPNSGPFSKRTFFQATSPTQGSVYDNYIAPLLPTAPIRSPSQYAESHSVDRRSQILSPTQGSVYDGILNRPSSAPVRSPSPFDRHPQVASPTQGSVYDNYTPHDQPISVQALSPPPDGTVPALSRRSQTVSPTQGSVYDEYLGGRPPSTNTTPLHSTARLDRRRSPTYELPILTRSISPIGLNETNYTKEQRSPKGFSPIASVLIDKPANASSTLPHDRNSPTQLNYRNQNLAYPPGALEAPSNSSQTTPQLPTIQAIKTMTRSPTSPMAQQKDNPSTDSSGFYQESYSRYPSTLDYNALQSSSPSSLHTSNIYQQPVKESRHISTSPILDQKQPSQVHTPGSTGRPMTRGDLSFGPSQDSVINSTVHGSSTFIPTIDGDERVPTPYPCSQKPVQITQDIQPGKEDSFRVGFGTPTAHSTPIKEPNKRSRVSPIPEQFEIEQSFRNRHTSNTDSVSAQSSASWQTQTSGTSVVRSATFRPSHRLLGEISFQLERRILDYIFAKRVKGQKERLHRRFYGYTVSNIPSMITRESIGKDGKLDLKKKVTYQFRYDYIIKSLVSFGYILEKHSQFSLKMINRYGLLTQPPDRQTMEMFGLQNPNTLRMFVTKLASSEKERANMMILLESLLLLAHDDGQSIFMW